MRVPFKRQDVRGDAIQEKPVVRHDEDRPREAEDRLLEGAQRAHI